MVYNLWSLKITMVTFGSQSSPLPEGNLYLPLYHQISTNRKRWAWNSNPSQIRVKVVLVYKWKVMWNFGDFTSILYATKSWPVRVYKIQNLVNRMAAFLRTSQSISISLNTLYVSRSLQDPDTFFARAPRRPEKPILVIWSWTTYLSRYCRRIRSPFFGINLRSRKCCDVVLRAVYGRWSGRWRNLQEAEKVGSNTTASRGITRGSMQCMDSQAAELCKQHNMNSRKLYAGPEFPSELPTTIRDKLWLKIIAQFQFFDFSLQSCFYHNLKLFGAINLTLFLFVRCPNFLRWCDWV